MTADAPSCQYRTANSGEDSVIQTASQAVVSHMSDLCFLASVFLRSSDTYWQTESGGILLSPLPGATTLKPGSATFPFFGVEPALLDPVSHKELPQNSGEETTGALVVKRSWPGIARTVLGDHERYKATYFPSKEQPEFYVTGDSARRDADGYWSVASAMHELS